MFLSDFLRNAYFTPTRPLGPLGLLPSTRGGASVRNRYTSVNITLISLGFTLDIEYVADILWRLYISMYLISLCIYISS